MLVHKEEKLSALIDDFVQGNETAFDALARLIMNDIAAIAYRYAHNSEDAKDIAQEVLIKLYRSLRTFRGSAKVSTWIYRVTVNAAIDFLRRRKDRTVPLEEAITRDEKSDDAPIVQIEQKDRARRIRECLRKLPLRQKNVVVLKMFEGLKIRQISKILGCSPSSVKTHLYRGIENLKRGLGGVV